MTPPQGSYAWPYVLNLGNTMLGVPMLAMPFCIQQCGCILGAILIFTAGYLSVESSILLLQTAQVTATSSYERTAENMYGRFGKSFISACIIAFIFGIAVASFVIIGDIIPDILNIYVPATESILFREQVIVFFAIVIIFPLCLIRQVERLVPLSIFSLISYALLIFYLFIEAFYLNPKSIFQDKLKLFDPSGLLICMPIVMTGFSCQAQVLIYLETFPDTMKGVQEVKPLVVRAMFIVCMIYTTVGLFGYFTFMNDTLETDLFQNLSTNFLHQILRLAFCISVIISYPMVIFPMRSCIYSLLLSRGRSEVFIPKFEFGLISLFIIIGSMIMALLVPDIGIILNITGGYAGAFLSFICPAIMFITKSTANERAIVAKLILFLGVLSLLSSPTLLFLQSYNTGNEGGIFHINDGILPATTMTEEQRRVKSNNLITDVAAVNDADIKITKGGRDIMFLENKTKIQHEKNHESNKTIKELDLGEKDNVTKVEKNKKPKKKIKILNINTNVMENEGENKTNKTVKR